MSSNGAILNAGAPACPLQAGYGFIQIGRFATAARCIGGPYPASIWRSGIPGQRRLCGQVARDGGLTAALFGKMPMALLRRLVSPFRRSRRFVLCSLSLCWAETPCRPARRLRRRPWAWPARRFAQRKRLVRPGTHRVGGLAPSLARTRNLRPARDPQASTWRSVERKLSGMPAACPGQLMASAKPRFQNGHQNDACALKPNTAAS